MSATCHRCGEVWARDPRLDVACPDCGAKVGVGCIRPSGHRVRANFGGGIHVGREFAAMAAGVLRRCPADAEQIPLFGDAHAV